MTDRSITVNSRIRILALCLCLAALPAGLRAQSAPASQIVFPHFVAFTGESTGIAIFNPNIRDAQVALTLRAPDGSLAGGGTNPVTLTIPAHGQLAKLVSEIFGSQVNADSSLIITSSTPGLVAYYQTFDPAVSFLDGSEGAEASTSLVFPVVPGPSEGVSEIDFANPNSRETSVELKLWNFDGRSLGIATVNVPGNGNLHALTTDLFPPGTDLRGLSHITATSKARNVLSVAQSVSGTSLFAGLSSLPSLQGTVDIAALNAVPLTGTSNSGAIPYFRTGGGYASTLGLVNVESTSVNVTVTAVANNGSSLGTRAISLNPQGGLRAPLQNIITALGSGEQEGWLLVQASGRVSAALIYGKNDAESLAAVPMQRTPKTEFVFPQIIQGYGYHTDITLANPTPNTAAADIRVIGPDGATLAYNQVAIGPSKRISSSLSQLMPEVSNQCGGIVFVSSNEALFATATIWSDSGSIASNFTPQVASFTPAPLTSFAVTGKVFINDKPAAGFRVVLSGPGGNLATSDANGDYAFTNLPAGRYSMMVDQFGFQFVPAQVSFEITTANVRQDFQGFTANNAILVQPASVPVGSVDTTVTIFGMDFNSTSEAFINSIRLQTAFVDSTRLQAIIPAYLLESPSTYELAVVTNGSDVSRRLSRTYPLVTFQSRPELTNVISSGLLAEGISGGAITLEGSGFLQGAKVKVNGLSDGIQVTLVNEAEMIAYLPASYLERGGIFPVTVANPYPTDAESNVQLLAVYYPPAAVETVLPKTISARLEPSASPVDVEVLGYGFRRGAVVLFDGAPLATTYCENDAYCLSTHLYAKIPPELLKVAGYARIEVRNPDPSLGVAQAASLCIEGLQPTITSAQPGSATLLDLPFKFDMPIIVMGTNFGPDTHIRIYKAEADPPEFGTSKLEVFSSTQLVFTPEVMYPDALGEWIVEVANTPPGGGITDPVSFFITEGSFVANPFLISLSPQTVAAGGPAFTLTVNGTNFKPGTVTYFNMSPLVTTVVSDRQVRAQVPASLIRSAGRVPISVANPDNGGTSNRLFLDIR